MLNLVTNGTGFIASHLVDSLVARGERVIIAGDLRVGALENIAAAMRSGLATFVYVDHGRKATSFGEAIRAATRRRTIDRIFHLYGAQGAAPFIDRRPRTDDFDDQTVAVIDVAASEPAQLILTLPFDVDASADAARVGGTSAVPHRARAALERCDLTARIVRVARCYGPRMTDADDAALLELMRAVLAGLPLPAAFESDVRHPLLYVGDAVELLRLAAESPRAESAPFTVCGTSEHSFAQIASVLLRIARARPEHSNSGVLAMPATPRPPGVTALEDGLRATLRWWRDRSDDQNLRPREVAFR
jgi:nucleoside-diphosphate-sugar epimerase